ncbi:MAG: DUF349 domain-containing protein [Bacteroidales bacterium]|nr:DUF349 domain-containing protein [Bacteroidales bacterium]
MNEELNQQSENTEVSNVSHETVLPNLAEVEAQETAASNKEIILNETTNQKHEELSEKPEKTDASNVSHETVMSNLAEVEAQEAASSNEEIILDENTNEDHASEKTDEKDGENEDDAKINAEKRRLREEEERIRQENLKLKLAALEDLRKLIDSEESLKTTYDEFKKLQEKWREIGAVPKNEVNNLWQNYHFLVEKFFDKVKINKDLRDLDLKKNLEAKIELCEKAEELLLESSINKSFKLLQDYHDKWKEIGPVSADKKDEIWERFKTASDAINQKRRDLYETQQAQSEQNYLAKQALFERVRELLERPLESINQWNKANDEINEILNLWKKIGRAVAAKNEEIWGEFKKLLNTFFERKRLFFSQVKDVQLENLNRKINLCIQAEALAAQEDFKNATKEILALQNEWKTIGPTAKKHAEKVWKRFRTACDTFFEKKNAFFSESRTQEKDNLKLKEDLINEVKSANFENTEKAHQLQAIKDFQKRWMNIGYVPLKEKDRLYNEFRQAINTLMKNLNIMPGELRASEFARKFANIQNPEDADGLSNKEVFSLQNKIAKMRDDILLWENNLGFFSKSKNADVLKKEVEEKILRAKQELALLEAKMKIIRQR